MLNNGIAGILQATDQFSLEEIIDIVEKIESLGYPAMWIPDFFGREQIALSAFILSASTDLRVTTGISNIYARDAMSQAQGSHTMNEIYPGRFNLGLGVSHPIGAKMRGHQWGNPIEKMSQYIQDIRAARLEMATPKDESPLYVAAHGKKMLSVAAKHADGANTYLMPPRHTAMAREIVGSDTLLTVVLPCCLCTDPEKARSIARRAISIYMPLGAYQRAWNEWGFGDELNDGGSDYLIDSLISWGDESAIKSRMKEHLDAGADQIVMIPYNANPGKFPPWDLLEALSPQGPT
jgi:probable F420-dependent oxidoreductase